MNEILEISYTGDLLAHRRCPRAWAYSQLAGFHSYEQAQALEGRLIHHSMEWLTDQYRQSHEIPTVEAMREQLEYRFKILWARGLKTAFSSKQETIGRVLTNLYPADSIHPTIQVAIEGASHIEYELRSVKKIVPGDFQGKEKLLITGILDLVLHQQEGFQFEWVWNWTDIPNLQGGVQQESICAEQGDLEIWDYKGTAANTIYQRDYVLQLLTYARLYQERAGNLPKRCVLFFINEQNSSRQLLAIPITESIIEAAEQWTIQQAQRLRQTAINFQQNPSSIEGGSLEYRDPNTGTTIDSVLKQQCTTCGHRFNCNGYIQSLNNNQNHPDVDILNVEKN